MNSIPESNKLASTLQRALPALKFLAVCMLILLLGIPTMIVGFLSSDRQSSARQAASEISSQWGGGRQILSGPYLIVPYNKITTTEKTEWRKDCKGNAEKCEVRIKDRSSSRQYLSIAPDVLNGATSLKTEKRYRGIYEVPVYTAETRIEGQFEPKNLSKILQREDEVLWSEAFLSILVSDRRTFRNKVELLWNGRGLSAEPGPVDRRETFAENVSGIHVPSLPIDPAKKNAFKFDLTMQGALKFGVIPNGRQVAWEIKSDWPDPSFSGLFLPSSRDISTTGFKAHWQLPQIARQQPTVSKSGKIDALVRFAGPSGTANYHRMSFAGGAGGGEFNVGLFTPVDLYSQVDRALKYAMLFIGFVMISLYLIELVGRDQAVHIVQYLFVGIANVVSYLLLLSFSEQVGFDLAYVISALATIVLIGGYCSVILRERRRAAIVVVVLVAVYVLLWALLNLADYALVVGSLMVFAAVSITMYATRKVNWYNPKESEFSAKA